MTAACSKSDTGSMSAEGTPRVKGMAVMAASYRPGRASTQPFGCRPGGRRGAVADRNAARLQRLLLAGGRAGRARDDGAGVAHGLAGRCGEAGDVCPHGLADVLVDVGAGLLLLVAADLAHHHDQVGARVCLEPL